MKLLDKILVATDFSAGANSAVEHAILLAKTFKSEILLLHVVPHIAGDPTVSNMLNDKVAARLQDLRTSIESKNVAVCDAAVAVGIPFDQIIQYSDRHNVNVIMIGAGEKDATDRFQLGITAERLIREATMPVWVVKVDSPLGIKKILCPVDYSDPSRRALTNAVHLARNYNAELTVVTVIQAPRWFESIDRSLQVPDAQTESEVSEQESSLDDFLRDVELHGVTWKKLVRRGVPHQEILAVAAEDEADLIALGTVGKSGLARILMGSVTKKVCREMPCSVITMKSEDAIRLRVEEEASDIEAHFQEGIDLLDRGFPAEAKRRFEYCLARNPTYAFAWDQVAVVYEQMGNREEAERCRARAKRIFQALWEQKVQAEIRGRHWLFGKKH